NTRPLVPLPKHGQFSAAGYEIFVFVDKCPQVSDLFSGALTRSATVLEQGANDSHGKKRKPTAPDGHRKRSNATETCRYQPLSQGGNSRDQGEGSRTQSCESQL